jgi:hypothetical protein
LNYLLSSNLVKIPLSKFENDLFASRNEIAGYVESVSMVEPSVQRLRDPHVVPSIMTPPGDTLLAAYLFK